MIDIIIFITGSSVIAAIILGLIKKFIKESVMPRFSDLTVLIILFLISLLISFVGYVLQFIPQGIIAIGEAIFGTAIIIYQFLYKAIIQKAILGKLDKDE